MKYFILYRYFDAENNLLYVGRTQNFLARNQHHVSKSHWFEKSKKIIIEFFHCSDDLYQAEIDAIKNEHPLHNIRDSELYKEKKKLEYLKPTEDHKFAAANFTRVSNHQAMAEELRLPLNYIETIQDLSKKPCDKLDEKVWRYIMNELTTRYGIDRSELKLLLSVDENYGEIEYHKSNSLYLPKLISKCFVNVNNGKLFINKQTLHDYFKKSAD